jgi:23S rRNA pseudouridine1911/1915/1917 synthase
MSEKKTRSRFVVPLQKEKLRIQEIDASSYTSIQSKSAWKKALKNNQITINDKIASTADFLVGGETICFYEDNTQQHKPLIDFDLKILFEDDYLALVHKPSGITVSGNKKWTLENALPNNLRPSSQTDALKRPEPIHRLDHPTSGILLIGKTAKAVVLLNRLFEIKKINKTYLAVTIGAQKPSGVIETPIDKKNSKTKFTILHAMDSPRFEVLNLVQLQPETGRKHQLRKHLAQIGNPILGDLEYGIHDKILTGNGLYLHAYALEFMHPFSNKKLSFKTSPPKKFTRLFPSFVF